MFFSPEIVSIIGSLFFILIGFLIWESLINITKINIQSKTVNYFLVGLSIVVILWLSMRPHLSRSLYWPTGVHYVTINLFVALFICSLVSRVNSKFVSFLIALFAASGGPNTASAVFAFYILYRLIDNGKFIIKNEWPIIIGLMLGAFPVVFAPGNFVRASSNDGSGLILSPSLYGQNFLVVFKEYLFMSKWVFIGGLLLGLLIQKMETNYKQKNMITLGLIFWVSAIASIAPFIFVHTAASKHTSIHFQLFGLVGTTILAMIIWNYIPFIKKIESKLVISAIMVFFIAIATPQIKFGKDVKKQITERHKIIDTYRGNTQDTLKLSPIIMNENFFTNRVWDLSTNPNSDFNIIYSEIFNTGPIVVASTLLEK